MKKIAILLLLMIFAISAISFAQETESKTKVKKTSTLGQKVHNTFSKHKHYNGYKVKTTKEVNGKETKTKKVVKTE